MRCLLAVDLGGTKTLCQLSSVSGEIILELEYVSQQFSQFELLLAAFLDHDDIKNHTVESACIAVAGPVSGRNANVTNLPWQINADYLANKFTIQHVQLCNDFEAVAHGIAALANDDIVTLQQGEPVDAAPRAVIGAGTGLGQALMLPEGDGWRVVATEGGHVDFAPTDEQQMALLGHLMKRFGHVSYERLVSGVGLATMYGFLRDSQQIEESPALVKLMKTGDPAAAISQFIVQNHDDLAIQAMDMFVKIYGAQAGNLALNVLPRAGLYLAGGIAAKNLRHFQNGAFVNAFTAKGKMTALVKSIPIRLILQPKVGLMGARLLAQQIAV